MSSQSNPGSSDSPGSTLAFGLFFCRTLAASVEVFLHREIGERYLGLQAAAVLLLVPIFSLGFPGREIGPLLLFLVAYLVMCAVARVGSLVRRFRGRTWHTYYTGWPRLMSPRTKCSELTFKRFIEPALLLSGGVLLLAINRPLGAYLMLAGVGLFISVSATVIEARTRALDMYDALLQQELLAAQFRELRGER